MTDQGKTIRWGIVGCGDVVETKSGGAFHTIAHSTIHAIVRRDLEKARQSAIRFHADQWYDHIDDLLQDDQVDAVYIATPPGLHYEQALACCRANKPVYVEKPFTRNYTEAAELADRFEEANLPLFVAHYRRALPRFIRIKHILDSGRIGEVCELDFRLSRRYSKDEAENGWLYNPRLSGGGVFVDIAPHAIDIMMYLTGDFTEVHGYATNNNPDYPVEDMVAMSFQTERKVIGTANFNLLSDEDADRMIIYGTKGHVEFSVHGSDLVVIRDGSGTETLEIPTPKLIEEPMIETVVAALLGRGNCPCTGRDALPTVKAMDTVLAAYYNGRDDDFWNRPESWGLS